MTLDRSEIAEAGRAAGVRRDTGPGGTMTRRLLLILTMGVLGVMILTMGVLGVMGQRSVEHTSVCAGCGYAIGSDGYCEIHGTADSTVCPLVGVGGDGR